MMYQTESKPQGSRTVAVFDDRTDRLLYLGRSSTQVRAQFGQAFFEVLDEEERDHVRSISLRRWHATPDAGRWLHQTNLTVPMKAKLARSALNQLLLSTRKRGMVSPKPSLARLLKASTLYPFNHWG